jgi:hypothetical protein
MRDNNFDKPPIVTILLLISFLSAAFLTKTSVVQAAPQTVVEVVPSTSSADVGQMFTVNLTIVDAQNLYGVEATVYWNSSILKLVNSDIRIGQADGVLNNPVFFPPQNPTMAGEYVVSATSVAPAPSFNGRGNIVRITFEVAETGYSNISLAADLYDYPPPDRDPRISLPIPHTTNGGYFSTVIPEIPSSVILYAFMILMILALVFSRRTLVKRAFSFRS